MQLLLCFVPQTLCCMTLISCWCSPAWPPSCLSPWCACACAPPPAPAWARVSDHAAGARHGDDHPTWSNILSETDKYFPLGFLLLNFAQWLFCQNFKWVFIEKYLQTELIVPDFGSTGNFGCWFPFLNTKFQRILYCHIWVLNIDILMNDNKIFLWNKNARHNNNALFFSFQSTSFIIIHQSFVLNNRQQLR